MEMAGFVMEMLPLHQYRVFHVSLPHCFTHRDTTKVMKCFRSLSDLVALNIGQIGENLALGNATVVNAAEGEAICGLCHPRFNLYCVECFMSFYLNKLLFIYFMYIFQSTES